jgi:hypothetical protein
MAIFTDYLETMSNYVPVILRRQAANVINLLVNLGYEALDAQGEALTEMMDTSWPLTTASGWVLDEHWGPYHDLQRNGQSDTDYRLYIRAKRLLNRSWGAADQALAIFKLLLPTADLSFTPYYPKAWTIQITGVDMATAAPAVLFMTKKPSPQGGGFSVCGDNGFSIVVDPECFNYSSVYGTLGVEYDVTGWFGSVYGAGGGVQAGYAHVQQI